jgi:preprotein translocase subunit SecF
MIKVIQNRKINYAISLILVIVSVASLVMWGLKLGLDFTGGSLMEVSFSNSRPANTEIPGQLADLKLGDIKTQTADEQGIILRFKTVDEDTHQKIIKELKDKNQGQEVKELRFESVGPVIGEELKNKSLLAIILASLAIILYIAYAFRKVSKPVVSWKYGVAAIIALLHDLLIVTGLFSLLGHFMGVEVDALFITALLTILGFSVHDTIVVFDRTRENLSKHYSGDFEEVVNDSVNQTISRSINTSMTTFLALMALYFFGGDSTKWFVLALIVGIIVGTYSSIFVASPLVVDWNRFDRRLKGK